MFRNLKKTSKLLFILILITLSQTYAMEASAQKDEVRRSKKIGYRVRGKRYHVMKTSKNYQEQGIASWYGRAFHRKKTSSGERFNMYRMTAAHKTLPLSTHVLVTNLKNGRKVIVKVNDRGPFVSNRLIDLSYAAAKKIGMVGSGIVPVNIQALA